MKNLKKVLKIALILFIVLCINLFFCEYRDRTNADAGYHSSYSGGGSSGSSSSYSSSGSSSYSSGSSRSSYSGSYSGGSSGDVSIFSLIFGLLGIAPEFIIFILIIYFVYGRRNRNNNYQSTYSSTSNKYLNFEDNQTAIREIKKYIPEFNTNEFLANGYDIFVRIENAWMNFDLESVRDCITDEMFNMYESQLTSMEMKGEQNIMKGFNKINYCITDATKENNMLEIKARYYVEFYDYIINKETKKVLRGNSSRKIKMVYEFTFIKDIENNKLDKCPNCGAPININSAGICEYCNSKLVDDSKNWVMSKKVSLMQQ